MKHLHEVRKVTFAELGTLLGVREMLKRGLILSLADTHKQFAKRPMPDGLHRLNMEIPMERRTDCGSVGCFGGYMAMFQNNLYIQDYVNHCGISAYGDGASPALAPLFFPKAVDDWEVLTNKQLVQAIDNWLENGKPRWEEVVKNRPRKAKAKKPARRRR